ncbi:type II secretion system F family protein [Glycomyces sp. NPDC046736]|uniref:type II secretion system F family protein n=1 Tax=Glycomyces sp. NPDC046736 TaxID=3155615 RepID=UPI0033FF9261
MSTPIAVALGAVFGLALVGLVWAVTGRVRPVDAGATGVPGAGAGAKPRHRLPVARMAASGAAVAAAWVATGWPVAAAGAGALIWFGPVLFGGEAAYRAELVKIDAIASWVEGLRDNLAAAAGLEQTITSSARFAPPALDDDITLLVADLHAGTGLESALRAFAARVDDETCDLTVMALCEAAQRAGNLAEVLDDLATAAREEAAMRMRIHTSRARIRTSVRVITGITVAMAVGLVAFGGDFLAPYDTPTGQVVMAVAFGCTGLGLVWLHQLAAEEQAQSFLRQDVETEASS